MVDVNSATGFSDVEVSVVFEFEVAVSFEVAFAFEVEFAVSFEVVFDFDFDVNPAWDAAAVAVPKSDQKRNMSERSEFVSFPDFGAAAAGTRRAAACGRLLLLPFLGETRKGSSRRATPGKPPRSSVRITKRQTPLDSRLRGNDS
jgi:hypothetical protein